MRSIAELSAGRLISRMERSAPFLAGRFAHWLEEMFQGASLADRFLDPDAFPILPLPWWVEESLAAPDQEHQGALATSSMAGYLSIRLIDNVMDRDGPADPRLLPVLAFLSTEFVRPYQCWFAPKHRFWSYYERRWVGTADLTARDAHLVDIDGDTFRQVSGRKTGAATIPVAAVCHLHGRPDRLRPWEQFVDELGRFHQFSNDLHSWQRDEANGAATWLLSEADRRRRPGESVTGWLLREGLDWAVHTLDLWMVDLRERSLSLDSPGLNSYVATRTDMLANQTAAIRRGAGEADRLARLLASSRPEGPTG